MNPAETRQITLTEFLLARIAEDERPVEVPDWYCTDSARGEGWGSRGDECPACGRYMFDGTEDATDIAWHDHMAEAHGRVLAECKAKRRIVEQARMAIRLSDETPDDGSPRAERIHGAATAWEYALDALALPYADHPDYREEWRA